MRNVNRRAFLRKGAASTALLLASPSWCAEEEPAPPPDSELVRAAHSSIERHRKGDATLRVEDASGKAITGAKVSIEQLSHEFLFGCNLFLFGRCGDSEREQAYRERFAALFNYATLGFYWRSYEPVQGKPNY